MEQKIPQERLEVLQKIKQYEELGGDNYFNDVENDPPIKVLMPEDVDYLKKKLSSKIKYWAIGSRIKKMLRNYAKDHEITINGLENLSKVNGGAVITSNHFHYFDCGPIFYALKQAKEKRKLYAVIREGNYQLPGLFGMLLRNYTTFPLSSNIKTTMNMNKAIDTVLKRGEFVYVYPEQAMWWKYRKPRKYRIGAYRWAVRNNVPVIPCFVTMEDMNEIEEDGLPKQKLTMHIGEPIYKNPALTDKENAELMLNKNHEYCVDIYEKIYGLKYEIN